ncbi:MULTISPECIES: DNA-binding protein [unclassified Pseudomonas]|uniref:DNA-binding protein n=1 Tax=unclassified Pseudomonas TaxID=196821 RepID=UPI000D3AB5C8|nr:MULTISPECIES: DNA-binding protein [unclassified Pseudomonas]RAU47997.1 hypothetical protein DBP26_005525 [Pseudomonas sp. RIT 409]RAU55309.1 hypothetical protein DBY65_005140 [Pseudomonas sp. RIT 412]
MTRSKVSRGDVATAIRQLRAADIYPSMRAVREYIGFGSQTTIHKFMSELNSSPNLEDSTERMSGYKTIPHTDILLGGMEAKRNAATAEVLNEIGAVLAAFSEVSESSQALFVKAATLLEAAREQIKIDLLKIDDLQHERDRLASRLIALEAYTNTP